MTPTLDTSLHERRRAERMRDPEFRGAYEQAAGEIAEIDDIIRTLDELRAETGHLVGRELARRIHRKRLSSVRQAVHRPSGAAELSADHRGRRWARPADCGSFLSRRRRSRLLGDHHGGHKELIAA